MNTEKIKSNIIKNAIKDDSWIKEAEFRQKNESWLSLSFRIATRILLTLDDKKWKQTDLAEKLGCSPQYLNKIIKGKENLTIETICKIEEALQIKLIEIPSFTTSLRMDVNTKIHPISMVMPLKPVFYLKERYNKTVKPVILEGAA